MMKISKDTWKMIGSRHEDLDWWGRGARERAEVRSMLRFPSKRSSKG